MKYICLLLCCFAGCLYSEETPRTLSFQQLNSLEDYLQRDASVQLLQRQLGNYHEHQVQIRGFLYQAPDQQWMIASEPNLKSCCIGSSNKIAHQILLSGNIPTLDFSHAVTIQGRFLIEPVWDSNGVLTKLYSIHDAKIISDSSWPIKSMALTGTGLGSLIYLWILIRKKPLNTFPNE